MRGPELVRTGKKAQPSRMKIEDKKKKKKSGSRAMCVFPLTKLVWALGKS